MSQCLCNAILETPRCWSTRTPCLAVLFQPYPASKSLEPVVVANRFQHCTIYTPIQSKSKILPRMILLPSQRYAIFLALGSSLIRILVYSCPLNTASVAVHTVSKDSASQTRRITHHSQCTTSYYRDSRLRTSAPTQSSHSSS